MSKSLINQILRGYTDEIHFRRHYDIQININLILFYKTKLQKISLKRKENAKNHLKSKKDPK